jgi:phosphopantothenoylcysteine decarboxylase/phosphopantothenate--cysteine ligase
VSDTTRALRIIVGLTGGIAAYKTIQVVRSLTLNGHDVQVVATEAALRFVGATTLEALSGHPVYQDLFDGAAEVRHIALADWCDEIIVAPASATTLAKFAAGIADDLLTAVVLATSAPVLIAPAMHTGMWRNPATRQNVEVLRARGMRFIGPAEGKLTSGDTGVGRLSDPEEIVAAALRIVAGLPAEDAQPLGLPLRGKKIVVTAGGTREPLDPVRFLGNRSTGRQGVAIAAEACRRGAETTLIAAHLEVPVPSGIDRVDVSSARQMQQALETVIDDADAVIMCAAVADFRPAEPSQRKIKKDGVGEEPRLALVRNPDILAEIGAQRSGSLVLVGFAAETESDEDRLIALGRAKLAAKRCDHLVVNAVGWDRGFGSDGSTAFLLSAAEDRVTDISGPKAQIAAAILDAVAFSLEGAPEPE